MTHSPTVPTRSDDTGSMPFAILIAMIGLSLSALLVPLVVTQITSTSVVVRRLESLQAAQAGMDVGLAAIRSARNGFDTDGNVAGNTDCALANCLPCNLASGGTLTGDLGAGAPVGAVSPHYRVTINYFTFDPPPGGVLDAQGQPTGYLDAQGMPTDAWISNPNNAVPCADLKTKSFAYALIRSQGTNEAGLVLNDNQCVSTPDNVAPHVAADDVAARGKSRCIWSVYTFKTTNANIPGGLIHVHKLTGGLDLCLSAGAGALTPAALLNVALVVGTCDGSDPAQIFAYNQNLSISLVASKTSATPSGMCLDSRANGQPVMFQNCAASTDTPAQQLAIQATQQWTFTSNASFVAIDGTCLQLANANTLGSTVKHLNNAQCTSGGNSTTGSFSPDAAVGAGAAGKSTHQLVNYFQFGRCMDVTKQDYLYHLASPNPFLISWPCKQNAPADWNQVWSLPVPVDPNSATGLITTTATANTASPAGRYCLLSPESVAPGAYVKIVKCPGAAPAHTQWTVTGDTGVYATSYRIVDDSNLNCLAPQTDSARTAEAPADQFTDGSNISKLVIQPCTETVLQKWNAPPNIQNAAPLKNKSEK